MKTPWAAALGIGAVVAVLILFWPASGSPATASPPDGIWSPPVFGRVPQADKPPSEATNRLPLVALLWRSGTHATSSSLTETHAYAGPVVLNLVGQISSPAMAMVASGLFAIDVSSLTAPTLAGNYDTPDWAWGVALSGTTVYVADRWGGLDILRFSGAMQTYSVSGQVKDGTGKGLSGVTFSDGAGHTATTNSSSNYTSSGLGADNYTVTPAKSGYWFSPRSRSVNLPPDTPGQNFTAALAPPPSPPQNAITTRVSVSSGGTPGNDDSQRPSISADGRYVAFDSYATNLVNGDTNNFCDTDGDLKYDDNCPDVFVRDRQTNQTERVSLRSSEVQANNASGHPAISADGRYVAFASYASNLAANCTNGYRHVFVRDRQTGLTECVSVDSNGVQGNSYSSWSTAPAISADGRYVAFDSNASNLVGNDDTNGCTDVFVRDRQTGQTERVSVASDGGQAQWPYHLCFSELPSISADGRYVAFESPAEDLVTGDTNDTLDIFVHDRTTHQTTRVSVSSDGAEGKGVSEHPAISADGRYVAFSSRAPNLVDGDTNSWDDIFVHDQQTGQTTRVSLASDGLQADRLSWTPSASGDGRYVGFMSEATNLVVGVINTAGRQVFIHDRQMNQTCQASVSTDGTPATLGASYDPAIAAGGRQLAFWSGAPNLVSDDGNLIADVFVRDWSAVSVTIPVGGGSLSAPNDGTTIVFSSGTFGIPTTVTYRGYSISAHSLPANLAGINHFFDLSSANAGTGLAAQLAKPYALTIQYTDAQISAVVESTLALHYWSGTAWVKEATGVLNVAANKITAQPNHFSSWAVLGQLRQTRRVYLYLPMILR
jgi:Tol biopolymer transport system component